MLAYAIVSRQFLQLLITHLSNSSVFLNALLHRPRFSSYAEILFLLSPLPHISPSYLLLSSYASPLSLALTSLCFTPVTPPYYRTVSQDGFGFWWHLWSVLLKPKLTYMSSRAESISWTVPLMPFLLLFIRRMQNCILSFSHFPMLRSY